MMARGQMIIVVALAIMVSVIVLALAVDSGRLYIERARLDRAAQSASDAGIGWVAEQMVTQALPRQTDAAARSPCVPDADYGETSATCTATPRPDEIAHWLTDDDRATLVAPRARATAQAVSLEYAGRNGFDPVDPDVSVQVLYPYLYDVGSPSLQLLVRIRREAPVLWGAFLGADQITLPGEGLSEIPYR